MFDIEDVKKELPGDKIDQLIREIRGEFPDDEMMFELHLMRAIKSMKENNG